jgi:hypothetical protein
MKTTIKALDDFDSLKAGHTYDVCQSSKARLVSFEDQVTHQVISLYKYQITDGTLRGKLVYIDDTQSKAMSCSAVSALCKKLPSGIIY